MYIVWDADEPEEEQARQVANQLRFKMHPDWMELSRGARLVHPDAGPDRRARKHNLPSMGSRVLRIAYAELLRERLIHIDSRGCYVVGIPPEQGGPPWTWEELLGMAFEDAWERLRDRLGFPPPRSRPPSRSGSAATGRSVHA